MTAFLLWLASALGETVVGGLAKRLVGLLLGQPIDEAERETSKAIDATRVVLSDAYGPAFGPTHSTFLDRDHNRSRLLRSTFPRSRRVVAADLDPEAFDGTSPATPELLEAAIAAFYDALDRSDSRSLDRDRGAQETQALLQDVAADAKATRDLLLADTEVPDALRAVLEEQAPDALALARDGRPAEAVRRLQDRIGRIEALSINAGTRLRSLLDAHLATLRLDLGNAHARAGDHAAVSAEVARIPDLAQLPVLDRPAAARLAYNARDAEALGRLAPLFEEGSDERRRAALWHAIATGNWAETLAALDAAGDEDGTRHQARARALIELGQDPAEAAACLDAAWDAAETPYARLAVAVATADLVEGVVGREDDAPGLDRLRTVQSASARLISSTGAGDAPILHALAHMRASAWFGFLGDDERYDHHHQAFDALALPPGARERLAVDPALDPAALARLADDGLVDQATLYRIRSLQHKASGDTLREEAALRDALDAGGDDDMRSSLVERLVDLRLGANDLAGAEAVLESLVPDDPMRPLLKAKVILARHGRDAARAALQAVLADRPRSRPALRSLALLTGRAAVGAEGDQRGRLYAESVGLFQRLDAVLPCRTTARLEAEVAHRLGRTADALQALDRADARHASPASKQMRAALLFDADRLPEAAQALAEAYRLDPTNPARGLDAGRLWIEAAQFDTAADLLAAVAADHPARSVVWANLGFALLRTSTPDRRASALGAFTEALALDPDLPIPPIVRLQAADAADDVEAVRQAGADMRRASPSLTVATADDLRAGEQLLDESGSVWLDLQGRPALEAFVQIHSDRAEAAHNLSRSDMVPYGGIATRPWTNWLATTDDFRRYDRAARPDAFTNRAPWPSGAMMRPFGLRADPVAPAPGLLLDLTALLTLASLDALDEGLRAAHAAFGRLVLYPGALADLRDEVGNLAGGSAWEARQPYPQTLALVERHALGPHPTDPHPAALQDAVPEPARTPLGNLAGDVGLALHLGAGFVRERSSFDVADEDSWGNRSWTSAEVLAALHRDNLVGLSDARQIAAAAADIFSEWDDLDPPPLTDLVVSGSLLTDWYAAGLLGLWMARAASWPALRVGPFELAVLRDQVEGRALRQEIAGRVRRALGTLDALAAEGVVEPLPRPADSNAPDQPIDRLWDHATLLFDAASERGLHVWADDRSLSFLLWRYDIPVSGPDLDAQLRALRARYAGTGLLRTYLR